jgi:transcriptional regulator with XRE-family HTH domain
MTPLTIRLRELRLAKGWTQAHLATAAGVTRATVNRIENGKPASIDLAVLEKLADALGVDPGFLIARDPPRRKKG